MKDASKANWPEGMMAERNTSAVFIDNAEHWYVKTPKDILLGVTSQRGTSEYRARQICALPQIVALLKEIAEQSLFFENENGEYEVTEYHHEATAVLQSIGEVE